MMLHWNWLLSDVIFWGLMFIVFLFLVLPKQKYVTAAWQYVGTSRLAVCTGVIVAFFITITALDCIHFKMQDQLKMQSALDIILSPLNVVTETSYSAPFATHAYLPTPVQTNPGEIIMMRAPLDYINANILSGQRSMLRDIVSRGCMGAVKGIIIWVVFCAFLRIFVPWKHFFKRRTHTFQWPTLIITVGIICVLCGILLSVSKGYHMLGTDKVGEDVFYQCIKSVRTGVLIGTLTTLVLLPLALILGMLAGFFRSWFDDIVQYIYTVLNAIPNVLLIAASVLMLDVLINHHADLLATNDMRADLRLLALCAILGVTSWTSLCRLVRGETLKLREQDYVTAAIALGTRPMGILKKHILPNLMHIIFITVTLDFSGLVLAEAVLSYVGVGVDPSTYSWGNMINAARQELAREPLVWWSLTGAFIFMLLLVLPANLFADVVQKAFDPRGRQVKDE